MTLKEELEILRGEPIAISPPADQIPCIETSDVEKLCKNPVVSVHMITYNHEPYIRQAIEGVMMQQTDFEFELIIGEDCSQDKTREICFEYQKKYPDKIRVLWSESNVHHMDGNSRRVFARCRGEFIAFCEGDDYWTDPHKLQKQVDIMRQHPDVGLCFTGAKILRHETGEWSDWNCPRPLMSGHLEGASFFQWLIGDKNEKKDVQDVFIFTPTACIRRKVLVEAFEKFEIFNWRFYLGDTTMWLGLSSLSNVYYLDEDTAVYRRNLGGVTRRNSSKVDRDGNIVRLYFLFATKMIHKWFPFKLRERIFLYWINQLATQSKESQKQEAFKFKACNYFRYFVKMFRVRVLFYFAYRGFLSPKRMLWLNRYFYYSHKTIRKIYMRLISK